MDVFATVEDLEARWRALTQAEQARAQVLLEDASDLIRSTCRNWEAASEDTRKRITCQAVKRAMLADDQVGVTQTSQSVGSFSESFTFANPQGDLYLTKTEKRALGGGGSVRTYSVEFTGQPVGGGLGEG